jgi:hypothetical protein
MIIVGATGTAQAQDFFSALFGGFQAPRRVYAPPVDTLPFTNEGDVNAPRPAYSGEARVARGGYAGGSQAYCVRTCDGRYFPIGATEGQSKAASCSSLCPASDTKVVYGSNIDNAATENGKSYSELPNAFKYRNEIVAGCTCNGKDTFGLASIKIEDDQTVRKGDIVAGAGGLMVAHRTERRHGALNFSPASSAIRARYERMPVVASE